MHYPNIKILLFELFGLKHYTFCWLSVDSLVLLHYPNVRHSNLYTVQPTSLNIQFIKK